MSSDSACSNQWTGMAYMLKKLIPCIRLLQAWVQWGKNILLEASHLILSWEHKLDDKVKWSINHDMRIFTATNTLGTCQTSMMWGQKVRPEFGQIVKFSSWLPRSQGTVMVWGTVFPNDCCSKLVGLMTKVWQPFPKATYTLGTCQTSMMCEVKK